MTRTRSGRIIEVPSNEALGNRLHVKATKSSLTAPFHWEKLPLIVQEAVLRELAEDYSRHSLEDKRCRAAYAAVNLQWQEFFEKLNFNKLVLRSSDMKSFSRIVRYRSQSRKIKSEGRQRRKTAADASPSLYSMPQIRHIWLRIELLEYDCKRCKHREKSKEEVKNNVKFTQAIWKLLNILSDWEKRDPSQNLTLELSAHSPSDSRHCFRDNAGLQDDYPNLDPMSEQRDYIMRYKKDITSGDSPLNDQFHGFSAGQYSIAPTGMSLNPESIPERLIRPLRFDFFGIQSNQAQPRHRLPEVKMVSSFVLRRQFYRELDPSAFSKLLQETLTGLRDIRYERWRLPTRFSQKVYEMAFGPMEIHCLNTGQFIPGRNVLLGQGLPSSLESLSLFEDTCSKLQDPSQAHQGPDMHPASRIRVLEGLAGHADNLKHLSVAFLSDAMDCFRFPAGALPNLQSLAITSREHLQPTEGEEKVRRIMLAAARAVTKLPKLQIMELWNCEKGHAAILRYEAAGALQSGTCELTWRSSWYMDRSTIGDNVIKTWEHEANKASRQLTFISDPLPRGRYSRYGALLRHLKLRHFILDPVSAMQVRVGTEGEGQPEVPAWKASVPYSPARPASHQN